jgi:hypothetical protein
LKKDGSEVNQRKEDVKMGVCTRRDAFKSLIKGHPVVERGRGRGPIGSRPGQRGMGGKRRILEG